MYLRPEKIGAELPYSRQDILHNFIPSSLSMRQPINNINRFFDGSVYLNEV